MSQVLPRKSSAAIERPLLVLVEEATYLLRQTSLGGWMCYLVGTIPFVVYLFYFWSDMSRSAFALSRVLESSLILTLLYGWMKTWQAVFAGRLMQLLEADERPMKLPLKGWLRMVASQFILHATMPPVLVLAFLALLPFAWAYAFYHNVTALAWGHFYRGGTVRELMSIALTQSHLAAKQNHFVILVIFALGVAIYANGFATLALGASLSKSITGVENPFSSNPYLFMSSSFQMLLICLSYLVINPLVKGMYALRCFYGQSLKTGADILAGIRLLSHSKSVVQALAVVLMGWGVFVFSATASADEGERVKGGGVALDQSIQQVLQGSEYQWRLPREGGQAESDQSWLGGIFTWLADGIERAFEGIGRLIGDLIDWMFRRDMQFNESSDGGGDAEWLLWLPRMLWVLVGALVLGLGWMIYRHFKLAKSTEEAELVEAAVDINLESEQVVASQLPENEWLRLAREKAREGDLRLALRALFLATLAHLGEKRLLTIVGSKSNGDYVRELGWKARGRAELNDSFREQVRVFDRVWYGWADVGEELMERFEKQHVLITSHAS